MGETGPPIVKLVLPDLLGPMPLAQLSIQEAEFVRSIVTSANSSIEVFVQLLERAQLDASRGGYLFKKLGLFLRRRKSVIIRVCDFQRSFFDMNFSFPVALYNELMHTPINDLLNCSTSSISEKVGVPEVFVSRLKDDLAVFKIVLAYSGKYSETLRLIDLV
jgi:hypothetical protein